MNQEEVDLIYDYLHENYEYREGELIVKSDKKNKYLKVGSSLGSVNFTSSGKAFLICSVRVNNKKYRMRTGKFIYIFHKKICPEFINHIDGNEMNNEIENLCESNHSRIQHHYSKEKEINFIKVLNKDGTHGYPVRIHLMGKAISLGTYRSEEIATEVYLYAKELIIKNKFENEIIESIKIKFPESSLNRVSKNKFKGFIKY